MISKSLIDAKRAMNEARDCSVIAIAEALKVDYEVAHAALKARGRKDRQGAYTYQILRAAEDLGFKTMHKGFGSMIAPTLKKAGRKPRKNMTVNMVKEFGLYQTGSYLAFVRGHVLAIVDGQVKDWTDGKRHQIREIYEVVAA